MQDVPQPTSAQASSRQLMERIDRLESLLQGHRKTLDHQLAALRERLADRGLDTTEKIEAAVEQRMACDLEAPAPRRPTTTTEQGPRNSAYRRMGRMV